MLDTITAAIEDRSPRGIAGSVSRLVMAGVLPAGTRLPTVRELATELGISPTTVSQAWRTLARAGVISPRGRSGTFVLAGPPAAADPRRYRRITRSPGRLPHDYSTGTPDAALLPDLAPVLGRVAQGGNLTASYLDDPVLPALEKALRVRWPFPPAALTVVDGAMDGLDRVTRELVGFGGRVLVENPCFPPLLDLLDVVGAEVVALPLDDEGVRPEALGAALGAANGTQPVALYLQPRAHNPTGVSMTARRAEQLAALLTGRGVTIVEDDHSGDVATARPTSLGQHLPDSTVHIRSFSKSHGPDLRLAAVGGVEPVVTGLATRRMLGPGWSSRLLQAVLAELLGDEETERALAHARAVYTRRRAAMTAALSARGVRAQAPDGINLWMEVADEQVALVSLAARGIGAAPGTPFEAAPLGSHHLRVTVGLIPDDDLEAVAELLAEAARG
ncbi:aminotransferase class I/II-fold pyridoxal phosphate-dependent enzyme [Pseudofrankia sp. DC12]|uniref:aminotransferase-like domain-containing protein n=1 Tax=Pseudofrankia sp. DC12 TaxID=683315 RepID=UPI0005F7897A|nr:aminotransferase class I/II-fold pyridoxal phosphate-dependent enzyme [Pseudofrankia sp. DC12]